jgi:hypothetical protein
MEMKYRIKEYPLYDGPRFQVQWKMFGLFWVDAGCHYCPADFNTFKKASEYVARLQHNERVKPVIHEL